jgi:ABC transport system ATP-binding/permease protein
MHERLAAHDQSDYEGLAKLSDELRSLGDSLSALESHWLELSEVLEA